MATTAIRTAAPCIRCEGTPGAWISDRGERHTCYGCNGTGEVHLTPAGLKARTTRKATRSAKRPAAGANDQMWVEFAAAYPAEAALVEARTAADTLLDEAYGAIATFDRRDSNTPMALRCIARHLAAR